MKICILRLSAIGDCINAVAAVRLIQHYYPEADITWIIGRASANLLSPLLPEVTFIPYEKGGIPGVLSLRKKLRGQKFDILLMMQYAFSASMASLAVTAEKKIGFDKERSRDLQWLFCTGRIKNSGKRHVVDAFADFAQVVIPQEISEKPFWNLHIPEYLTEKARKLLFSEERKVCFLNPCTSKESKDWDWDCCCEIIAYLYSKGLEPVLLGGRSTREKNCETYLRQKYPELKSLAGRTSLVECMACISLGFMVISADTAAVHMANALGVPVIGLYATHDPRRVGPYLDKSWCVSVYEDLVRQEYHTSSDELPWRTRVHLPGAMKKITPDMIKNKIDQICESREILREKNCFRE